MLEAQMCGSELKFELQKGTEEGFIPFHWKIFWLTVLNVMRPKKRFGSCWLLAEVMGQ